MQTVLNIPVILSLAVQNIFSVLRPLAANSQLLGNANAASVLPRTIMDQISDPATKTPSSVIMPKASETPAPVATATSRVKETATPDSQPCRPAIPRFHPPQILPRLGIRLRQPRWSRRPTAGRGDERLRIPGAGAPDGGRFRSRADAQLNWRR